MTRLLTTPWRKILRDCWGERTRSVLVVAAIGIGAAAVFAILGSYAILTRELDRGYLATNPASATLWTDAVDDTLVRAVLADREVRDAEPRRVVSGRLQTGPMRWRPLVLFVIRDFDSMRVSRLQRDEGAWPPARGEILIERDALRVAHARPGDRVVVQLADGGERTLKVSGSVHDVGQAQARMENIVYGYVTLETLALLGEQPVLNQLKIVVADRPLDEAHIRSVAANVKQLLERRGHPVTRLEVPTPGRHPHAAIMGTLLLSMSTFGLFLLLLSGILVANLLTAVMAGQVRQIAVMKTLGAGRPQIARLYLAYAALLGAAAVAVAFPLGMWGTLLLCRYEALFLNFDITSFAVPAWVLLCVAAVGLIVPIGAAAFPVWQGSGVPVREGLADFGVSRNAFGATRLDRLLAGLRGVTRPLLFAVRNSFRRRGRLVLTVATLAAGGLFFMTALNVRASFVNTLDVLFRSRKYDLTIGLDRRVPFQAVWQAVKDVPGVVRGEGWISMEAVIPGGTDANGERRAARSRRAGAVPGSPGSGSASHDSGRGTMHGGEGTGRIVIFAIPPDTTLFRPVIAEGRGLRPGDTNAIVINSAMAGSSPTLTVGSLVALQSGGHTAEWRIVGIAREPFSPPVAYVSRAWLEAEGGTAGLTNNLRLALKRNDADSVDRVKAQLESRLLAAGFRALSSTSKAESRYGFDQHMLMIYVFLVVMSAVIALVGGLGLTTTMSLNVLERRREMGILRALGATPRTVTSIVVAEAAAIGVMSWALAATAAMPVSKAVGDLLVMTLFKTGLDRSVDPSGPVIWLVASVAIGIISGLVPAWHAGRSSVREALGYE